ncbi:MAG: hypothetical protein CV087_22665 [Candidatus Brocadia sp. WS118]|nr:MAG: hypothetical protein CV087_22665 [Candidatus Brocadia sp. WS118]
MQKHKVKLGKWSKTNKGYREVLVNGYCVGEVTKDCMWSVHCFETVHLGSYRKMAEYLAKKVITIIEHNQQYYTSVYNAIKEEAGK